MLFLMYIFLVVSIICGLIVTQESISDYSGDNFGNILLYILSFVGFSLLAFVVIFASNNNPVNSPSRIILVILMLGASFSNLFSFLYICFIILFLVISPFILLFLIIKNFEFIYLIIHRPIKYKIIKSLLKGKGYNYEIIKDIDDDIFLLSYWLNKYDSNWDYFSLFKGLPIKTKRNKKIQTIFLNKISFKDGNPIKITRSEFYEEDISPPDDWGVSHKGTFSRKVEVIIGYEQIYNDQAVYEFNQYIKGINR